jgi:uncharacterized protein (DUF433 family)
MANANFRSWFVGSPPGPFGPGYESTTSVLQRSALSQTVQCRAMTAERMIVVDPEVMNGMPCFRGTRVPFKNLMDYLEGGHCLREFLDQFPTITREMAVQALEEAKESLLDRIA